MERKGSAPEPIVISRDEGTEVHVSGRVEGGRRQVDVRVWRPGSSGVAPASSGLLLETADAEALHEGLGELLEASHGGRQLARVVWDGRDGRRLRAEIEPFGARHVARLGFWQCVRNTWRPADDGLIVAADDLRPLREALHRFQPWLEEAEMREPPTIRSAPSRETLERWPLPGSDWLTVEADRVAFHPRGVRITCTTEEQEGRHWLIVRQWRREESLWIPEPVFLALGILDLDNVLAHLRYLRDEGVPPGEEVRFECSDGSSLRLAIEETSALLLIERRPPDGAVFESRLAFPAEYLARFGRAMAQSWSLLLGWLSDEERAELESRGEAAHEEVSEQAAQEASEEPVEVPVEMEAPVEVVAEPEAVGRVFPFGAESATPGMIVVRQKDLSVTVEGGTSSSIRLPLDLIAAVVAGLDELNVRRVWQSRVDPHLLCDRSDCSVYGRVGTLADPQAVELRVWTTPTTSDSINFDALYLPDLIEGLRRALQATGRPIPASVKPIEQPAGPPAWVRRKDAPAHWAPVAPSLPLVTPGPAADNGSNGQPALPASLPLGVVRVGPYEVSLTLHRQGPKPALSLDWEGNSLDVTLRHLGEMLSRTRALYYDALLGRRGRTVTVGEYPLITIGVHSQGAKLYVELQQEIDAEVTALSFPASDLPGFLDSIEAAVTTAQGG